MHDTPPNDDLQYQQPCILPYYQDATGTIYQGNVIDVLRGLPDESVPCVVTSPPYWSLRDYQVDGQIGLEKTPEEYIAVIVQVFREVRRVLRKDGVCFINLGDSFYTGFKGYKNKRDGKNSLPSAANFETLPPNRRPIPGLKPKDLCGIPWRVAFALQADGWYLRSDIIWSKPNPMPEGVTDRPTKSHEYIFLLTKSAKYFWDAEAVREPQIEPFRLQGSIGTKRDGFREDKGGTAKPGYNPSGRNIRSVWTLATQPWKEAHFATFPEAIPERCIKAGTSEKGCCPKCGKPWERVVERGELGPDAKGYKPRGNARLDSFVKRITAAGQEKTTPNHHYQYSTTGWQPGCSCGGDPVPCVVLDPFGGAGTVGLVAEKLNRKWILIELNPEYCQMARDRILKKAWNVEEGQSNWIQEGLFA